MNFSFQDLENLYRLPFNELIKQAHDVYQQHHAVNTIHLCGSLSIKTGNCPEDCAYCPQSVHYKTYVSNEKLLDPNDVFKIAVNAKKIGVTHFCLGAAWSYVPKGSVFQKVLEIVRKVHSAGLQVCCSLGSISEEQIQALLIEAKVRLWLPEPLSFEKMRGYMTLDKKSVGGKAHFILLERIGKVRIVSSKYSLPVADSLLKESLEWLNQSFVL